MDMSGRGQSTRTGQGVRLCQVYPPPENEPETDVDIIAIHGLDTESPATWIWRASSSDKHGINWLAHPYMLPDKAKRARIFYCNWPARLFNEQSTIQMTVTELARRLLLGIHSRPGAEKNRPLLFIASCLGGVILSRALVIAARSGSEYASLWRATGGVVFLATPFRGTAFKDLARVAVDFLKGYAKLADRAVTNLLESVTESTPFLEDLVGEFTLICQQRDQPCQLAIFYETEKGNLLRKARFLPQLAADFLNEPKVLVDSGSARLDMVTNPVALERTHVLMNKFDGPGDPGYIAVAGKIQILINEICEASPLKKADDWIRYNHYTADRLEIERLSGETLSMEQCYINLAIVEQPGEIESRSEEEDAQRSSPFSLAARLNVEIPGKDLQVDLRTIFEKCERPRRPRTEPRRILIRGRAGVGKTTLCKRIVYDFIYHGTWRALFDRILWVPLRNLKMEPKQGYNLGDLLFHEYLSQTPKGKDLAHKLWVALDATQYRRTLFILDGLDEVSGELDESSKVFRLLKSLLMMPNVITTSRPRGSLPYWLKRTFDLELEAIGFYPDQVNDYIKNAFTSPKTGETDSEKADKVQSFFQKHQLIQGLVRIPTQLDALCYTWDDFDGKTIPQTMSAVYQAIEERLWKKDAVKLEKYSQAQMQAARARDIWNSVQIEIYLLEVLAFTGMHNDMIEFEPEHRDAVFEQFDPPRADLFLDETLSRLSFLRTSDPSSNDRNRNYHFIHLTFQEYFAARYFVRQWKAQQPLTCLMLSSGENEQIDPVEFLRRHKYHARYDILWRFIAGLLDTEGEEETLRFFKVVDEKPLDLLGPTHQRLIMHSLSEVRHQFPLRSELEGHLSKWLIFQCKKLRGWDQRFLCPNTLASEIEFPEQAIVDALQEEDNEVKIIILGSMESRQEVPPGVTGIVTSWLQGEISDRLTISILHLFSSSRDQLPVDTLNEIAARLEDQDWDGRVTAIKALGGQSNLQEATLDQLVALLKHQDRDIRGAAVEALGHQSNLQEVILHQIAARLEDQDWYVRRAAVEALFAQANLPLGILHQITVRLQDQDRDIRKAAVEALFTQSNLPPGIVNQIAWRLGYEGRDIRQAAVEALGSQSNLLKATLNQIAARLDDQYWGVRAAAVKVIGRQSDLQEVTLNQIAARLEDQNSHVRGAAIKVLGRQSDLQEVTLNQIAARLEDQDSGVRRATVDALEAQLNLPEDTINQIAARLEHQDSDTRGAAVEALGRQSNLQKATLSQIAARLKDRDSDVRGAAIKVLGRQSDLQEVTLNQIAARLEDQDSGVRRAAVKVLGRQSDLQEVTLNQIAAQLKHQGQDVRGAAVKALGRQLNLQEATLNQIAARLEDQDSDVRGAAIKVLGRQSDLQKVTLNQIAARLEDQDSDVRRAAVEVLEVQSNLPEVTLDQIAARLKDQDIRVTIAAKKVLEGQSSLPEGILDQIAAQLEHQDWQVRRAAIDTLEGESNLQEATLDQIIAQLEHEGWEVRRATVNILDRQWELPEGILKQIAPRLKRQDRDVRRAAVEFIGRQSDLQEANLNQIAMRLEDQDSHVRGAAVKALGRQSNLPAVTLNQIAARLEDQDSDVRRAAVEVLGRQSDLPEVILNQIAARLKHQDRDVRKTAVEALGSQSNLQEATLNQIAARLNDQYWDVRGVAIDVLGRQSDLPEVTLSQIAAYLEYQDSGVRSAAVEALGRQSNLPAVTLNQIAARLEHQDRDVRRAAVEVIGRQSDLQEVTLNQIAARLNDQYWNVRGAAVEALGHQSNLQEVTLNQIAARLEDQYFYVRSVAVKTLQRQSNLPEVTLNQIAARLEDQDSGVRRAAVEVLEVQSNLPEVTLDQIAARLKDQDIRVKVAAERVLEGQSNLPESTLNQIAAQLKDPQSINVFADPVLSPLMELQEFHSVCLVGGHAQALFPLLLNQSFNNHLAWYIQDGKSCLETDNRLGCVELSHDKSNLEVAIKQARDDFATPAVGALHEVQLEYSAV
ncbi:hypothetical protein AnigIFM59636_003533 [Aspergillus niger]|nr:hypothetical protein AnigIFM59636_003533 [Aspergillus niger]